MGARRRQPTKVDALLDRLAYRCFPDGCPRSRTCCDGAAVEVSRREARRIEAVLPELAALQPRLRDEAGPCDVFGRDGSTLTIEPADESGRCPFLFTRGGRALCAIHSWAADRGEEVSAVKPRACRLWPLTIAQRRGRRVVTIVPQALSLGCVAPLAELPGQPTVRQAFAAEIAELLAQE
jgi:hypothetical protein